MNLQHVIPFSLWCHKIGLPAPVEEYRFDKVRRWRFDFAWPDYRVALEKNGGVWIAGRHSGGKGQIRDFEKFSEAAAQGWRIIHVTPQQLLSHQTIDWLRRSLVS